MPLQVEGREEEDSAGRAVAERSPAVEGRPSTGARGQGAPLRASAWAAGLCGWAFYLPLGSKLVAFLGCAVVAFRLLSVRGRLGELKRDAGFRESAAFWGFVLLSALWTSGDLRLAVHQLGIYSLLILVPAVSLGFPTPLAAQALRQFTVASAAVGAAVVLSRMGALPFPGSRLWSSTVTAEGNQSIATSLLLAVGAGFGLILALHGADRGESRRQGLAWLVAAVLAAFGLAFQEHRSGMLALPLVMVVIGVKRQPTAWRRGVVVASVLAASLAAFQGLPVVRQRLEQGIEEIRNYPASDHVSTSWGMRLRQAEHTLDMVRERPWIGHGVGSWLVQWRRRVPPGLVLSAHVTPHNEYLLIAAQFGLAGFALILWLLGSQFQRAWRAGPSGEAALIVWTVIALAGLFNVVLRDAKFALPLLLLAGLAGSWPRSRGAVRPDGSPAAGDETASATSSAPPPERASRNASLG